MGGAARGNGSPLQGFGVSPTPPQADAQGWYESAPLGLNANLLGLTGTCFPRAEQCSALRHTAPRVSISVSVSTMNENKQPSLLESIAGTAVLLLVLLLVGVVVVGIPFLIFEGIARLAFPVPSGATPELQQSVARQRELLVRGLFITCGLVFLAWWMLTH